MLDAPGLIANEHTSAGPAAELIFATDVGERLPFLSFTMKQVSVSSTVYDAGKRRAAVNPTPPRPLASLPALPGS